MQEPPTKRRTTVLIPDKRAAHDDERRLIPFRPEHSRYLRPAAFLLATIAVIVAFVWAASFALHVLWVSGRLTLPPSESTALQQVLTPRTTPNTALVDVVNGPPDSRASSISLVLIHTDAARKRVWRLWIPPEVVVTVPGEGPMPIGDTRSSGEATAVSAVKQLTGLTAGNVVELGAGGVVAGVDNLGGVPVNVPAGLVASSTVASGTPAQLTSGYQVMDGRHALAFAIADSPTDRVYTSLRDQQILADAAATQYSTSLSWALGAASALAPSTRTSMGFGSFVGVLQGLAATGHDGTYDAVVVGTGITHITSDPATLKKLVSALRAEKPFGVPSATPVAAALSASAAVSSRRPSQVSVTVRNGGGISGAAKQAAALLSTQGFKIDSTGNANLNVYAHTLVVYKSDPALGALVSQYLPAGATIVPARGLYAFPTDVLVVVGKDWDITKAPVVPIKTD